MTDSGKKTEKKNGYKLLAAVFLLLVLFLYVLIYVADGFTDRFIETYTAEYGTLDVDLDIDYLAVRDERLHTADTSGTVNRVIKQGRLMRTNSRIVTVGAMAYYSQIHGIVSYSYDGLEKTYSSKNLTELTIEDLTPKKGDDGKNANPMLKCQSDTVEKGDAIFKIVDNKAWYLVTWLDAEDAGKLSEGKSVTVEMDDQEKTQILFRVFYIEPQNDEEAENDGGGAASPTERKDKLEVVLSCDRAYSRFDRIRYGKARLIITRKTGIILETASIVTEGGMKGVYVQNKYGEYLFTPVSIISEVGDKTVVESRSFYDPKKDIIYSTVKNYDSVKKGDAS